MCSPHTPAPLDLAQLRSIAAQRLADAAADGTGTVLGVDAMNALLALALAPAHAAHALALQQELLVHQIEIDALLAERQGHGEP